MREPPRLAIDVALSIPQFPGNRPYDLDLLRRWVRAAERAGLHSLWAMDGVIGPVATIEPVTLLAHVSALTSNIRLGLGVIVFPRRSPVQLAKALVSLDHLSAGRLTVGLGVGGGNDDYRAFGTDRSERVQWFTSGLDTMRRLWAEPRVTVRGPGWTLSDVAMEPKPLQEFLPVWIGARSDPALRRAAKLGDGFLGGGMSTTAEFAAQVRVVRSEAAADFPIGKRVYIDVDPDRRASLERLRRFYGSIYGSTDRAEQGAASGPVDVCVEQIVSVVAAGAELIVLNPIREEPHQLAVLTDQLVPALREAATARKRHAGGSA